MSFYVEEYVEYFYVNIKNIRNCSPTTFSSGLNCIQFNLYYLSTMFWVLVQLNTHYLRIDYDCCSSTYPSIQTTRVDITTKPYYLEYIQHQTTSAFWYKGWYLNNHIVSVWLVMHYTIWLLHKAVKRATREKSKVVVWREKSGQSG